MVDDGSRKYSFEEVLERIKEVLLKHTGRNEIKDYELGECLGMTKANFSIAKKKGRIPFASVFAFAEENNLSLDWLFLGREEVELRLSDVEKCLLEQFRKLSPTERKVFLFYLALEKFNFNHQFYPRGNLFKEEPDIIDWIGFIDKLRAQEYPFGDAFLEILDKFNGDKAEISDFLEWKTERDHYDPLSYKIRGEIKKAGSLMQFKEELIERLKELGELNMSLREIEKINEKVEFLEKLKKGGGDEEKGK